jgi:hypothetical protein
MLRRLFRSKPASWKPIGLLFLVTLFPAIVVQGQKSSSAREEPAPFLTEFRGIGIGMTSDEVRKKLGAPSDKGDEQDFFVLNDNETVQVVYDKTHKVMALSFDFSRGARDVPTPKAVFGSDIEAKPDGSMYKMVRYPKAGYWLSYNRTSGAQGMTSVTFQKID